MKRLICLGLALCLLCCGCANNSSSNFNTQSEISSESKAASTSSRVSNTGSMISSESEAASTLLSSEPLATKPSEEKIKDIYHQFVCITDQPYPENFNPEERGFSLVQFAFYIYLRGFNGKTIEDFPIYLHSEDFGYPINLYEAPTSDIIECLSAYFDGIDCESAIKSSMQYNSDTDTCQESPVGSEYAYIYILRNTVFDPDSGILKIEACHFTNGIPKGMATDDEKGLLELLSSGFDDYETNILTVQLFADGHWRYLSYEKLKNAPIDSTPLATKPSDKLINDVYGQFYWIANAPYPESFDEEKPHYYMINFAFERYREGFNGKTIDDFPVYHNDQDIVVLHEAPSADIINCLSTYFDGIDCEKVVKSSFDYYDAKKDTCKEITGLGGGHCYIVFPNSDYDEESGLLTIEACHFEYGIPEGTDESDKGLLDLINSGFEKYDTYILKVKFFADGHWRYLSYKKQ